MLREATREDIKTHERRKWDKQDDQRRGYGMLWIIKYADDGRESAADLAFLKADKGWAEIDDARELLMGPERYAEAVGRPV